MIKFTSMQGGRPKSISGGTAAGWLAVLLLFAVSAVFSSLTLEGRRQFDRRTARKSGTGGNLLAEISRRPAFAFGFRNFLSDIAWLKAIQVAGVRRMTRADYDELYSLLDTVINFDPLFKVPYYLGGLILGDSRDHAREAIFILNRGWKSHPTEWRLPFHIGYIRYFSLGDPMGGGKMLLEAARIPDSPAYLPLLASRMLSEGKEPGTALAFLDAMMEQETDPVRRNVLERRIREVIVERDIQRLERAVQEYRSRVGKTPESLSDVVRAGIIGSVPREPNGGRYLVEPDGTVRSDRVAGRMKVFHKR